MLGFTTHFKTMIILPGFTGELERENGCVSHRTDPELVYSPKSLFKRPPKGLVSPEK